MALALDILSWFCLVTGAVFSIIAGVGMIPFDKPGRSDSYDVMGGRAVRNALDDAGVEYDMIQQAYCV